MSVLRLATYNIHKCVGPDGRWDPDRIFAVIGEMRPDVLAVQEFDSRRRRGRGDIAPDAFAEATGMRVVAQPTLSEAGRFHGNLLLSRLPVVSWRLLDLTVPTAEPRGAVSARIELSGLRLRVVATHLGLWPAIRRAQLSDLLAVLEATDADVVALLGDLNEWLPWGGVRSLLDRRFGAQQSLPSYPSLLPFLALDTVRIAPAAILRGLKVHDSPLARRASDHLPLVAQLDVAPLTGAPQRCPGDRR